MKRFSDTARMEEDWYCLLPLEMKAAFEFMWAKADAAGVWVVSHRLAEFHVGKKVNWPDFLKHCAGKVIKMDDGRYLMRDLLRVNYGNLSRDCRAHSHVFAALERHSIDSKDLLSGMVYHSYPIAIGTHKEQEEETEQAKDQATDGGTQGGNGDPEPSDPVPFDDFWAAYPRRVAKGNAEAAWKKLKCDPILAKILTAIRVQKSSKDWTKEAGQFIPHPATWLNRRGWEDEAMEHPAQPEFAPGGF